MKLTALISREGNGYVALNPETDVASQGNTVEEARDNLKEALELFFECASPAEINRRLHGDFFITQVEVALETYNPLYVNPHYLGVFLNHRDTKQNSQRVSWKQN